MERWADFVESHLNVGAVEAIIAGGV
jgi:hypothetical protein